MCGCGKVYIPLSDSEDLYKGFKSSNRCPVNEEFLKCGSSCEPSCENPHPKICTAECILDVCQCKEGYVRRSDGRCVKMANSKCHENERFWECGTACELTCEDPEPRPCTRQCILNVCRCLPGYVRRWDGACVEECDCTFPCFD
ncbi:von Willebrand factor-like [Ctenocephalides felis]|uniref:von Willebrand factor-like n=1 Tax=Ctenocephalides felis TaxID=7515 RepID=UPI000E6E4EF6|nr:von Willebrand factor-like [Ctenocephalides felis]